jgi:hypothetical protein
MRRRRFSVLAAFTNGAQGDDIRHKGVAAWILAL